MFYHAYPLGVEGQTINGVKAKPLSAIVKELGHTGRRIDLLKVDCEGCEWDTYGDWMSSGLDIRQILVELHWIGNATRAQQFYKALGSKGYVAFSKEPITLGCGGD